MAKSGRKTKLRSHWRRLFGRGFAAPARVRQAYIAVRALHVFLLVGFLASWFFVDYDLSRIALWLFSSLLISFLSQIFVVNIIGHRFIGHNNFKPSTTAQFFFLLWSVAVGLSSPLSSSLIHRRHHQCPDTDRDPHSPPQKGFGKKILFFAQVYLNFFDEKNFSLREIMRESRRPFFIFFHRAGAYLSLLLSLALYMTFGLEGVFFLQTVPVLVCFVGQFNLVYRTHVPDPSNPNHNHSVDSVIANILTLGEGAHDAYHRAPAKVFYPTDQWLMFDFTGFIIKTLWKKS